MSRASERPPHGYLTRLSVENLRCFRDAQTLQASRADERWTQWTVVLGDNGVGKTTLLQAVAASAPARHPQFTTQPPTARGVWAFDTGWPAGPSRHWPTARSTWAPAAGPVMDLTFQVSSSSSRQCGMTGNPNLDSRLFAYGASRAMGRRSLTPDESPDPVATLFSTDAQLLNPIEWLQRLDYDRLKGDAAAAKQLTHVIGILTAGLLPDVSHLRVLGTAGVVATTPYGEVPLDQLGLGYQTVLAWLVDLVWRMFQAYPELEDPLSGAATVLVDEIDLHLHPRWQRQIIEHLTKWFPNTQWIVTAHSPLIVQAAEDANIAVLRREGDHVVIDQAPEKIRSWRVDQILTSDLFGLRSARPLRLEKLLDEREQILGKKRKSAKDKARLAEIEAEVGELDTAETPEDREAMDLIRRAAEILKP